VPSTSPRRIIVLGSTGSIGVQTLDVVAHLNRLADQGLFPHRYEVVGLAAGRNVDCVLEQARQFGVRDVAVAESAKVGAAPGIRLREGQGSAERLVREVECDIVLAAMVGFAGLPATLAAVELGRDVALANKETLVAAGELVTSVARRTGSKLLPVDSEHSAVWQCLASGRIGAVCPPCAIGGDVARVILTASGGALRDKTAAQIAHATPEDALNHPTWKMGAKVTIDSASLTNKALELIEAHWLFGLEADRLGVLVHPQSIVHSIVDFADGSSIAQLGLPDMRTPIQIALTYPERVAGRVPGVAWETLSKLDFRPPDLERFPAVGHGFDVIRAGGTLGAVLNAANERAVEVFLDRKIPFGRIPELQAEAMRSVGVSPIRDLRDALDADAEARRCVSMRIGS
jgi:1-deoxy-D-xylulose-5-phosphate reductoisomerase